MFRVPCSMFFLAHLWGAHAIHVPFALSVTRLTSAMGIVELYHGRESSIDILAGALYTGSLILMTSILASYRRVSSVSTVTTRNNKDIKSIFGADVHHVPGLCLLDIGGAAYISHKIMAQKPNFHIFDFFSETTSRWCFILC